MAAIVARRGGRKPWRWWQPALVALACCLTTCTQTVDVQPHVTGSTFWLVPVARTQAQIVPFNDGEHAWVLEKGALHVTDAQGYSLSLPGPLPRGETQISEVIPTNIPGRAWAIGHTPDQSGTPGKGQVFLLNGMQAPSERRLVLKEEQLQVLREQPPAFLYNVFLEAPLPQDTTPRAYLWVTFRRAGQTFLAIIDAEGNPPRAFPLGTRENPKSPLKDAWRMVTVKAGQQAWLKTTDQLFFVDAQTRTPLGIPLPRTARINWVVPGPEGTSAWVVAEALPWTSEAGTRQLYRVWVSGAGGGSSLLLEGEPIRQVVPSADGARLWVAGAMRDKTTDLGGIYLLDGEGRSLLPLRPLLPGEEVFVAVTHSGWVWLLTRLGSAYLVSEDGSQLAHADQALPSAKDHPGALDRFISFPLGDHDILLWESKAFHVKPAHDPRDVQVTPLLGGLEAKSIDIEPAGDGAWFGSAQDGNLYFVPLRGENYLKEQLVLKAASTEYVFPLGDGLHGWVQGEHGSFAYLPLSEVGAVLKLEGGSLEVKNGGQVIFQGRLDLRAPLQRNETTTIELQWPGSAQSAQTGGVLEFSLWDENRPGSPAVASGTRHFGQGIPSPQFHWSLDDSFLQEGLFKIIFRYRDQTGIDTTLEIRHIRFSAPLVEQIWFRTSIACLIATMLLIIPLVLLPRTRTARSWLPFIGWGLHVLAGSGLAFLGVARGLKIHFPIFVGVLFVEVFLGALLGALSPPVFRLLAAIKPFQWLTPLALAVPAMRRRLFAPYVAHVWRKLESQRIQANNERYICLPADLREGGVQPNRTGPHAEPLPVCLASPAESLISHFLTAPNGPQRGNVLIESPGGRGKSALLRESVRQILLQFEREPSGPLPVFCDARGSTLLEAAQHSLEADPLVHEMQEVMLQRGDFILVVDGLTESSLSPDAIRGFIDGRYGQAVPLLCTCRPHEAFRQAIESSSRWMHVEPRRLDEEMLDRFVKAYSFETTRRLQEEFLNACRGPDGTYLPILVRLALLFVDVPACTVSEIYEAAFRGLLRKQGSATGETEDSELLAWSSAFCLRTYWADGVRSLRYRNSPEQGRLEKLLKAGVLIPDEPFLARGQCPLQVRFFHDSMQSYLTACGLFAQEHSSPNWDVLLRAAAAPLFTSAQSEISSGTGSELFQMCLEVFGPEERLRKELQRQLLDWAHLYDDSLTKRDICEAVPPPLQQRFHLVLQDSSVLAPGEVLRTATVLCAQAGLPSLGALYMHIAARIWPLENPKRARTGEGDSPQPRPEEQSGLPR
jgi:hypothetical protein